ncbi:hypothetical protein [uncultured Sphingobacterium sp.]|uniref:IS66 family insertion sequence element accessory protein TnpA n=1 Tax=uncultured Sphingobacterium sp. TaxID=182688 RepID=UPI0025978522|nr:hypothetical protein [uncultured Sphingobacterium sp.]
MKKEQSKSQQRYQQLYRRWKDSGKGVRVFCQQESIKYSTFRYWIKRLETGSVIRQDFIEMKLDRVEVKSGHPLAELRLTEKGTFIFYELPEPAWVKALLS